MKPNGKRHRTIPVQLGGQFSAGDPSALPDGTVSILRNYMIRPNRFEGRAPFVYDLLDAVSGFAVWQDMTNELRKTVATCSADNKLYTKNANGTGYGAGLAGLAASARLTGYTNFLNKLWMAFDNGAGVPTSMAVYDGTTISTTPFNSAINCRSIVAANNRNFLIDPRVTITNQYNQTRAYDLTVAAGEWLLTNCVANNITSGASTVCRVTPTAAGATFRLDGSSAVSGVTFSPRGLLLAPSADSQPVTFSWSFGSVHPTYDVPLTVSLVMSVGRNNLTAYTNGWLIVDAAGNRQRCTVAGTSGAGAPAFATTVGATTADGTVTWICEGTNVLVSNEFVVRNSTISSGFVRGFVQYYLPPTPNLVSIYARVSFGNSASPTYTLAPIDVSLKDGLADADPNKKNYGFQLTIGDFYYPFFNKESTNTATVNIDAVVWTEISDGKRILARNTYPITEIAGLGTAGIFSNGRIVVFKRSGMWIFKGNADPYEPILPESPALSVGCIGPLALDVSRDNDLYWIGENHVYKMKIGADSGPTMIDSPGMFEEIFARGGNWVESQSTYNMPLLAIDHVNKDVWVYTQKGKIYIYSIQAGLWSYIDTNPTGTSAEVRAMIFDPTSNRMLVSFGGAAATRFDETSDAADTIVAGGGTSWNIADQVQPKPFELFAARYEAALLEVGLFHLATLQNGSLTIEYSLDRGATWTTPAGYPVTSWIGDPRIRLALAAQGVSVTIRITRTGSGGARNFTISKMDALLRVHRGESPRVNPT